MYYKDLHLTIILRLGMKFADWKYENSLTQVYGHYPYEKNP